MIFLLHSNRDLKQMI